jgi:hypothetical protein
MRRMSFGLGGGVRLSPLGENNSPEGSPPPPHQVQTWLRRRLEDTVEDVFRAALLRGDLASAEDLLGVLENIQARARVRFRAERRGTALMIERARKELEARKARRRPGPG